MPPPRAVPCAYPFPSAPALWAAPAPYRALLWQPHPVMYMWDMSHVWYSHVAWATATCCTCIMAHLQLSHTCIIGSLSSTPFFSVELALPGYINRIPSLYRIPSLLPTRIHSAGVYNTFFSVEVASNCRCMNIFIYICIYTSYIHINCIHITYRCVHTYKHTCIYAPPWPWPCRVLRGGLSPGLVLLDCV